MPGTPNDAPIVTFIVPAYNAARTLPETLQSLQGQAMPRWAAVVVDDGSQDNPAEVVRAIGDPRITVVTQQNRGLAGARNTGLRRTTTPLVSFLDADDTIDPDFCGAMIQALGEADAVACAYELTGPNHEPLGWVTRPAAHDVGVDRLIETNPFVVTGLFRLEGLRRFGALPSPPARPGDVFDESLRVLEDWDLWLRSTCGGLAWGAPLARPVFRYRLVPGLSRNIELMWTTGLKVITRAPVAEDLKPRALRRWTLRNAARAIANEDAPLAVVMLATLSELCSDDLTQLTAALGPAFQRAELVGPREASSHHAGWRAHTRAALGAAPWCDALLARFDTMTTDWAGVARRIAASLGARDIPTIYGMGWNGQLLITELAALLPTRPMAWIDDTAEAAAPASVRANRITVEDLTPRHALVITPNDPAPILAKLAAGNARVLWPPQPRAQAA